MDARLQAQCYEVWFDQFARLPQVEGMFWWKWPSHGRESPFDPSHRPLGKLAADVLSNCLARLPGVQRRSVVVFQAEVGDHLLPRHPSQRVLQLHELDEQVVLRVQAGGDHR